MTVRERILQDVRAYVIGTTGLPADSVLIGPLGQNRPAMPYALVTLTMPSAAVATPETVQSFTTDQAGTDQAQQAMRQHLRATATIALYGDDVSDHALRLRVGTHDRRKDSLTEFVTVSRVLSATESQAWRGTDWEIPATVDLDLAYRVQEEPGQTEHAERIEHETTLHRGPGDPSPLTVTGEAEV